MKVRILVIAALLMLICGMPVLAEQNVTNVTPGGSTNVTGVVSDQTPGSVTYTLSIPQAIDFGTLQQPADTTTAHYKDVNFDVKLVEVSGLTSGNVIGVLMKDATDRTDHSFAITGNGTANSGKNLTYTVLDNAQNNIGGGTLYTNGYLFSTFNGAGQSASGTLRLDQNQLAGQTLSQWAGSFNGTINFYSRVVSVNGGN